MPESIPDLISAGESARRGGVHITTFLRRVEAGKAPKPIARSGQMFLFDADVIADYWDGAWTEEAA